jgi:glycosyltransferase involved in cell wall biosynthesis
MSELADVNARTGAVLHLVSGPSENPSLAPIADFTKRIPWTLQGFADDLSRADIAIAPLRDDEFSRGKCAYKLLQYAATGLPFVVSPVGVNAEVAEKLGGVAVGDIDWVDSILSLLIASESKRKEMGLFGIRAVRENYAFATWRPDWATAVLGESLSNHGTSRDDSDDDPEAGVGRP